jgi:hypothetical protein
MLAHPAERRVEGYSGVRAIAISVIALRDTEVSRGAIWMTEQRPYLVAPSLIRGHVFQAAISAARKSVATERPAPRSSTICVTMDDYDALGGTHIPCSNSIPPVRTARKMATISSAEEAITAHWCWVRASTN